MALLRKALDVRPASIDHGITVLGEPGETWRIEADDILADGRFAPIEPVSDYASGYFDFSEDPYWIPDSDDGGAELRLTAGPSVCSAPATRS